MENGASTKEIPDVVCCNRLQSERAMVRARDSGRRRHPRARLAGPEWAVPLPELPQAAARWPDQEAQLPKPQVREAKEKGSIGI